MYNIKYNKYITKLEQSQNGGNYGFSWKYSGKINLRQFSARNNRIIQRAIDAGLNSVVIEHNVSDGPDIGKVKIYNIFLQQSSKIVEYLITPDQHVINSPTNLQFSYTGPIGLEYIPVVVLQKEYFTNNNGIRIFNQENQKIINNMIIDNRYTEDVFDNMIHNDGIERVTQLKINSNNTVNYYDHDHEISPGNSAMIKQTIVLRSKLIYNLPLIGNIQRAPIDVNSIIVRADIRLVPAQVQELLNLGITSIKCSVPEIDRLTCSVCMMNEKNRIYLNCGHMSVCDSCAISWTLAQNRRVAGRLVCICPECVQPSPRFVDAIYGGEIKN
jgi:hypothetical protein